jgi:hypothetical protein
LKIPLLRQEGGNGNQAKGWEKNPMTHQFHSPIKTPKGFGEPRIKQEYAHAQLQHHQPGDIRHRRRMGSAEPVRFMANLQRPDPATEAEGKQEVKLSIKGKHRKLALWVSTGPL